MLNVAVTLYVIGNRRTVLSKYSAGTTETRQQFDLHKGTKFFNITLLGHQGLVQT